MGTIQHSFLQHCPCQELTLKEVHRIQFASDVGGETLDRGKDVFSFKAGPAFFLQPPQIFSMPASLSDRPRVPGV